MTLLVGTKTKNVKAIGYQRDPMSRFLDTVGDGSGVIDAVGAYGSPTEFIIAPGPGEIIRISRMIIFIEDSGTMDSGFYGNGLVLANGINVIWEQNGEPVVPGLTSQTPIKTNGDVASLCHDLVYSSWGTGNTYISARWTFTKFGQYVRLIGDRGDKFGLSLHDDFSGLVKHRFSVQGYYE